MTLYVMELDPRLAIVNRWRSDGEPNVVVRRKFWNAPDTHRPRGCTRRLGRWSTRTSWTVATPVSGAPRQSGGTTMSDLSETPDAFLLPIARVIESILAHTSALQSDDVMVVGAWCRDIWHHALGHTFATAATRDLDLALALSSWEAFDDLAGAFPRIGDTGIGYRIAGITVACSRSVRSRGREEQPIPDSRHRDERVGPRGDQSRVAPSPAPRGGRRAHPERGGFRRCQARCVARPVRMARSQGCDRPGSDPVLVRRVARGPRSALRLCPRQCHPGRRVGGPATSGGRASRSPRCQHHRSGADIGNSWPGGPATRRRWFASSSSPADHCGPAITTVVASSSRR